MQQNAAGKFSHEMAGRLCAKTISFLVRGLQILAIANA
jgi:hypothetical protein